MRELGTIFPVLDTVKVQPIFSLMIALPVGAVETEFEAAAVTGSEAFQFISLESKKPNYSSQIECQSFVAISTFEFASKLLAKHPQQKNFKFVEQVCNMQQAKPQYVVNPLLSLPPYHSSILA